MQDDGGPRRSIGRGALAVGAIVAIILVCGIGYLVGSRAVPQNNLYSSGPNNVSVDLGAGNDSGAIPTYSGPPPVDQVANQAATAPPPAAHLSVAPDVMDGSVASTEAPAVTSAETGPPAIDADRQGSEEIGDAIQAATQDALDRGTSVRWHKDGLSGFAIVSVAITDGGRTCRNAYSTTVRDAGETRTATIRWCRTGADGPWAAQ